MKKIVFITRHDPTKIGGGAFATRAYLEALSCIYPKRVVLFVADSYQSNVLKYPPYEIVKVPPRPLYQSIPGIFLGKLTRFEKVFTNWMKENGTSVSKVVFDGGIIGGTFISAIKKYACETITIHHNYEYEYQKENKSIESLKGKFLYWIQKFEKRAFVHSDINLFLTQPDLNLFVEKFGDNKSKKSVLSCFEYSKDKSKKSISNEKHFGNQIELIISGSLGTYQTADGVFWFLEKFYPELKQKYPSLKLTLTGRSPNKELMEKCKIIGVNVVASPINIREVIEKGNIYICPTRLGGGIKLRIMDALALGMPCLIHEKSYRGYEKMGESNYIEVFSGVADFFEAFEKVLSALQNNESHQKFIVEKYEKEFSFAAGVEKFKDVLGYEK